MNETYLLTLHPEEPYFFGNEKTFLFNADAASGNRYFIKGEPLPSQTTLLGAMRYLLMPVKNADFRYTAQEQLRNGRIIGEASFDLQQNKQSFGAIAKICPVFLLRENKKYVHTPFDHVRGPKEARNKSYVPFAKYHPVETDKEKKWFAADFNSKDGLTDTFMDIENGSIVETEEIFKTTTRVGIDKNKDKKAFFKKQYHILNSGWSFGAYVTLDTQLLQEDAQAHQNLEEMKTGTTVYLGQNKAAFTAKLLRQDDTMGAQIARWLRPDVLYCFSDALVSPQVYDKCVFAATKLRDYRAYFTSFEKDAGRIRKGSELYKMLTAGSILIPSDMDAVREAFHNEHYQTIGFNYLLPEKEDTNP